MLRTKQAKGEKYNITADNTENKTFFFFNKGSFCLFITEALTRLRNMEQPKVIPLQPAFLSL